MHFSNIENLAVFLIIKGENKMTYSITYSSRTGNTKELAQIINENLNNSIYYGEHDIKALDADRLYIGFWTDKGTCDSKTIEFLKQVENKEIFLFGTAGFGESEQYFNQIIDNVKSIIKDNNKIIGSFMCQGKMPQSVRDRYIKLQNNENYEKYQMLINNFDKALEHPNNNDKSNLIKAIK